MSRHALAREYFKRIGMQRYGWLSPNLQVGLHSAATKGKIKRDELVQLGEHFARIGRVEKVAHLLNAAAKMHRDPRAALSHLIRETARLSNKPRLAKISVRSSPSIKRRKFPIKGAVLSLALTAAGLSIASFVNQPTPRPNIVKVVPLGATSPYAPSALNQEVEKKIQSLRAAGKLEKDDHVSVVAFDLENEHFMAHVESTEPRNAASLIKPFIMLAAYHKVKTGTPAPEWLERQIEQMIVNSNNPASRKVLRFIGGPEEAQRIITQYGFANTKLKEYIPSNGRTYKNQTSANDLNVLLYQLHHGQVVDRDYSTRMLRYLDQYTTSRLASFESQYTIGLAGKTGYVAGTQAEATQVTLPNGKKYNFVAIVENKSNPRRQDLEWHNNSREALKELFSTVHAHASARLAGNGATSKP